MGTPSAPGGPVQVVVPGSGWVDVASRAIVQVGFPVVVAAVLLWFLLTRFQTTMDQVTTRMERNAVVLQTFVEALQANTAELKAQTQFMEQDSRLMAQIAADSARLVDLRRGEVFDTRQKGAPR